MSPSDHPRRRCDVALVLNDDSLRKTGLLGGTTVRWDSIEAAQVRKGGLRLHYPDHLSAGRTSTHLDLGGEEALQTARHDRFPQWLLSQKDAVEIGVPASEAAGFGPPLDTQWVPGETDTKRWNASKDRGVFRSFLLFDVTRVGVFRQGVVFDAKVRGLHVFSWRGIHAADTPSAGGVYWFRVLRDTEKGGIAFLVTAEQGRAVLGARPRDAWELPDPVWASLGMA